MKRGEMQKKFFRFLDRLPYFPFYRTIVLNVKVKINETANFFHRKTHLLEPALFGIFTQSLALTPTPTSDFKKQRNNPNYTALT